MSLFFKECKFVLKLPVNFIYIFFLFLLLYMGYMTHVNDSLKHNYYKAPHNVDIMSVMSSQGSMSLSDNPYNKYMMVPAKDKRIIADAAIESLWSDYLSNNYFITQRISMKHISLSEKKQERIYSILLEMEDYVDNNADNIDMDVFYRILRKAGAVIGSNNDYQNPDFYFNDARRWVSVELATYDEALSEYNKFAVQDGVSGGLARIFAQYISIACLLLGAIVSIFYLLKDEKHKEVLAGKSISGVRLFLTKYAAVNIILFLPVLILGGVATIYAGWLSQEISAAGFDVFAFLRVSLLWIFPTIMFATAFSMFITVATNTMVGVILIAPVWWLQMPIGDSFGLHMTIISFSSEFSFDLYRIARIEIIVNRLFYTGISVVLVCVAVWLYNLKRGGKWNIGNLFRIMQKKHQNIPVAYSYFSIDFNNNFVYHHRAVKQYSGGGCKDLSGIFCMGRNLYFISRFHARAKR